MAFLDVLLNEEISKGSKVGPGFKTKALESPTGIGQYVGQMSMPRHRYDLRYGINTWSMLNELKDFHMVANGGLHSWKMKDWLDFSTRADGYGAPTMLDQVVGTANGVRKIFDLYKTYVVGGYSKVRRIRLPLISSVLVAVNGVLQTSGYSISSDGKIFFTTAPAAGPVTWGGYYYVHARFMPETDEWLGINLTAFEQGDIGAIMVMEDLDDMSVEDARWWGGAEPVNVMAANVLLGRAAKYHQPLNPGASGRRLYLPGKAIMEPGGPRYALTNLSASFSVGIYDSDADSLSFTLGTSSSAEVVLGYDSGGLRKWYGV